MISLWVKGYNSSSYLSILREQADKEREAEAEKRKDNKIDGSDSKPLSIRKMYVDMTPKEILFCSLLQIDLGRKDEYVRLLRRRISGEHMEKNEETSEFFEIFSDVTDIEYGGKYICQFIEYMLYMHKRKQLFMEVDSFIILPQEKLILEIETKSACEDTGFPKKLKVAAKQTDNFFKFIKAAHSNILSEGWRFVKAVALPLIQDIEREETQQKLQKKCECCKICMQFVLDQRKFLENLSLLT